MSNDFEWHTREDETWHKPTAEMGKARRRSFRPLLILFLIGLILGLTGLLIYRLVFLRAAANTAAVEADVLTAHRLIRQADRQDDLELFRFTLSSRDLGWLKAQEQLLESGSLLDRPAFGLKAISDSDVDLDLESPGAQNVEVLLSPDLTSAEVQFDQAYSVEQTGATIHLRQTLVYQLGERWLLVPPNQDFWGGQETLAGEYLQATYPERDKELVKRLASDLDKLVQEACRTLPDLACPETLQIQLDFKEEIDTLSAMGQVTPLMEGDLDLELPTLSLVGWPLDEASYQVLRRGYGVILLTALIAEQVGYQCCRQGSFYQAMLDAQLSQLGLRSWPLADPSQIHPDQLSGSSLRSLNDVGLFWFSNQFNKPAKEIWPVYLLVDFFKQEINLSMVELQRNLVHWSDLGYRGWLGQISANLPMSEQDLERAWLSFNQERVSDGQQTLPAPPQQDLQLTCRPNRGENASIYRYNFEDDELSLENQLGQANAFMIGFPDDEGVVVVERGSVRPFSGSRMFLWQDGREILLTQTEHNLVPVLFKPSNQSTVENLLILNRRQRQYTLLPLQDCLTTRKCNPTGQYGFPLWSPDGSSLLLMVSMGSFGYESRFERPLSLSGVTRQIIGIGKEPFWLDDQTAGFISPHGGEIRAVDTGDLSQRTLLTVDEITGTLSSSQTSELNHLAFEFVAIKPNEPDSLLIVAKSPNHIYFISADRQGNKIELEHSTEDFLTPEFLTDLRFSPDGRWLVISTNDLAYHVATIAFYDTIAKKTLHYRFHARYDLPMHWHMDWSADGAWLSIIDNGYIRLIAPEFDHQRLIVPDDLSCMAAVWIN